MDTVKSNDRLYIQMVGYYAPAWGFGGPIRIMYDYAVGLAQRFRVAVLAGNINHDLSVIPDDTPDENGLQIRRYKVFFKSLYQKSFFLISPRMFFDARGLIEKSVGPVFLHICEVRGVISLYVILLKMLYPNKVKIMHSAFGMLHYKKSRIRNLYDALFMRTFLKRIDFFLAQNDHEVSAYKDWFKRLGVTVSGKILLQHLHVNLSPLAGRKDAAQVKALKERYAVDPDVRIFMFLGRIHPAKGILRAIDAFVAFDKKSSAKNILWIIGRDDGFQREVERVIDEKGGGKIFIINNVYESRFDYYVMADVFLGFPSIFEETMLASVEALSCGTPMIVSKEADIPFVEAEGAGFVIDYSILAAVEAMEKVTHSLGSYQENAAKVMTNHFDKSQAVESLAKIING